MYSITLCFLKLFICYAISSNLNFAVNLVTSFSRQKPLKSKNKKRRIFWNTKFYHPAKSKLKQIKSTKVKFLKVAAFCVLWAHHCGAFTVLTQTTNANQPLFFKNNMLRIGPKVGTGSLCAHCFCQLVWSSPLNCSRRR